MNRFDGILRWAWSVLIVFTLAFALGGCDGDDGKDGLDGADGADGMDGADGAPAPIPDPVEAAIEMAQAESCATCHGGIGDEHQAVYDQYSDASTLALDITNVDVQDGAVAGFDVTLDFSVSLNNAPYIDPAGNGLSLDSTGFYFAEYDAGSGQWLNSAGGFNFGLSNSNISSNGDGTYTLEQNVSVDPRTFASGALMGRIANGKLDIEERQAGKRITMYADNASDFWEFGNINAYTSPANVEGCENCHGAPYFKHGNYPGMVAGTPDFTVCKACHNNSSAGGHPEWQFMVDQPEAWASGTAYTAEQEALYAYDRTLVNDVHMSHAMEFPYPQSMANCNTCHGDVDLVLADENFTVETCKSCHVIEGENAWPALVDEDTGEVIQAAGDYYQPHRPPPVSYLWANAGVDGFEFHNATEDCTNCHKAELDGGFASTFAELHSGYDEYIYDANGDRYADTYTAQIDSVTYDADTDTLTVEYQTSDVDVVPELLVSFYGWDTKDFIVPSHWRDANSNRFEFEPGDDNPLFTADATVLPPNYKTTANLSAFAAEVTADIPTLIESMDVSKIEVTITPYIDVGLDDEITLNGVTATYDLMTSGLIDDYFKGDGAIADYEKCNACHDQLAVTFHSGSGRAGEMTVCRNCHASTNGGSHLEMQSRSIEGYVHAIHSFQDFDLQGGRNPGIFDAFDAVEAKRYDQHIEHAFPYFTALACEACHNEGTYNAPDQSKSMPGLLSESWMLNTWYEMVPAANGEAAIEKPGGRNIGFVPEYVVGASSKACGGCHRAELINEDKAGDLAAFNAHTDAFGTLVKNDAEDAVLFGIIDKIMTLFE